MVVASGVGETSGSGSCFQYHPNMLPYLLCNHSRAMFSAGFHFCHWSNRCYFCIIIKKQQLLLWRSHIWCTRIVMCFALLGIYRWRWFQIKCLVLLFYKVISGFIISQCLSYSEICLAYRHNFETYDQRYEIIFPNWNITMTVNSFLSKRIRFCVVWIINLHFSTFFLSATKALISKQGA